MIMLIWVFACLIVCAGVLLMLRPALVTGLIESNGERVWIYASVVGARVVLGLLLIQQAGHSKFPLVIEILGWISLGAAIFLAVMGPQRFSRFLHRILDKVKPFARFGGLFAVVFGAFLLYAFV